MFYEATAGFIALVIWAVINYFAASLVKNRNPKIDVHPWYYAIGSFIFGGIFPLIFLGGKLILHKSKK
jgi:hypothetical protein